MLVYVLQHCLIYWNGTPYNAGGSYIFNTTNAAGCDSAATLNSYYS